MHVQQINFTNRNYGITSRKNANSVNKNKVQKDSLNMSPLSFKGNYNEIMSDVFKKDMRSLSTVDEAINKMYHALLKEEGLIKSPLHPLIDFYLENLGGVGLVSQLCKPGRKMASGLQEYIIPPLISSEVRIMTILSCPKGQMWLRCEGELASFDKFANMFFDYDKDSPKDVRLAFNADDRAFNSFILGPYNDNGKCTLERYERYARETYKTDKFRDGKRYSSKEREPIDPTGLWGMG